MIIYFLGWIVCAYALVTSYSDKHVEEHKTSLTIAQQIGLAVASSILALLWPIVLGAWMREVKKALRK